MPIDTRAQTAQTNDAPAAGIAFAGIESGDYSVHYAYAGDVQKPGLLFIHGTPGSWQAFADYLADPELQRDYFLVAVDRPGWGKTRRVTEPASKRDKSALPPYDFAIQSQLMSAVMQRYPGKQWLLVGHSLGASIAPRLAIDAPQSVSGMLLLAGSLTPEFGNARWYNIAASMLLIKWMLPGELKYSNDEIMALKQQLETLDGQLETSRIDTEVIFMQGMRDRLVSPGNPASAMQRWQHSFPQMRSIELPQAGHFLPWDNYSQVVAAIRGFEFPDQSPARVSPSIAQCDDGIAQASCAE